MYDTVKISLETDETSHIPDLLMGKEEKVNFDTNQKKVSGNFGNFFVHVFENEIRMQGSWAKFYFGNNIETLGLDDVRKVVEKLSDEFHLPIEHAKVYRFDFGTNFILKNNCYDYLSACGCASKYKKITYDLNGLLYRMSYRELSLYDKLAEMLRKKAKIPEFWMNKFVLRYEIRFLSNLIRQLKLSENLRVSNLYEDKFFKYLVKRWADEYFAIEKIKRIKFDFNELSGTVGELKNQGLLFLIKTFGESNIKNALKNAKNSHQLDRQKTNRLKHAIDDVLKNKLYAHENDCILELDEKVKGVVDMVCSKN